MVAVRTAAVHIAATRMALAAHTSRDTVMAAVYIAAVCMAAVCMTAVCMAAGIASSTSNGHSTPANADLRMTIMAAACMAAVGMAAMNRWVWQQQAWQQQAWQQCAWQQQQHTCDSVHADVTPSVSSDTYPTQQCKRISVMCDTSCKMLGVGLCVEELHLHDS